MGYNEADTRAKFIESKLYSAVWDKSRITREYYLK